MADSATIQRFAAALSQLSGLSLTTTTDWAREENGPNNNVLGIMPNGHLAAYPTPEAGAQATWALLQNPMYAGIRNSAGQSVQAQLQAIIASPWNTGKPNDPNSYAGTGFRALSGMSPGVAAASSVGANGVVATNSNQATTGCWIKAPTWSLGPLKLPGSGACLISDQTGRKLAGAGAMAGGSVLMLLGLWFIAGQPGTPKITILNQAGRQSRQEERSYRREAKDFAAEEQRTGRFDGPQPDDELQARREQRRARRTGRVYDTATGTEV